MLELNFNEKEQRLIRAFIELDNKLEDQDSDWTVQAERHHQILSNCIARMIANKFRELPWEE